MPHNERQRLRARPCFLRRHRRCRRPVHITLFPRHVFQRNRTNADVANQDQKFNWSVLDDEEFERLMFRLFFELEFDNVQWLQKTRAADSGRDISAERLENGNRVLIQARHQKASVNAPDVNDIVVKAETWNPAFDEVIIVTTSSFTQEAIRWAENHNANPGERPTVTLEPHGHIEVMLTQYPALISHLGLR